MMKERTNEMVITIKQKDAENNLLEVELYEKGVELNDANVEINRKQLPANASELHQKKLSNLNVLYNSNIKVFFLGLRNQLWDQTQQGTLCTYTPQQRHR